MAPTLGGIMMEDGPHTSAAYVPGIVGDWKHLLAELDPAYFDAYTEHRTRIFDKNPLDEKTRELIAIAVDVSVTHLYAPGLRNHIRHALQIGVTSEEILAVFKLVFMVGVHTFQVGAPILQEELRALEASGDK